MKQTYSDYDYFNMCESIRMIPQQIIQTVNDKQFNNLKSIENPVNAVIIVGMGSSLIAFKLIKSLYEKSFLIPVIIINNSILPSWADKTTLVIFSSYSGNSIEVLSCAHSAIAQKCIIIGITTGGKLLDLIKDHSHFIYRINPDLYNPCKQPRMAIGFSFGSYLKILQRLNILSLTADFFQKLLKTTEILNLSSIEQDAKKYSEKMQNKYIQVVSGGYLAGNAELFSKQLNWNSKQYASFVVIPEAMHHLCEGIIHPTNKKDFLYLILSSSLLESSDTKNLLIIMNYLRMNKIPTLTIKINASTPTELITKTLLLSSFISFHLSMLYKQNPTPTPAIDYYKKYYKYD